VRIVLNGDEIELDAPATVAEALAVAGRLPEGRGTAVALNGEVVSRREWAGATLSEGDRLEVLTATRGG
jgi:sulfur carrier protein